MKIIKVPIEKCELWDKNPRGITKKDFERLKKQIQKLGVYKPLVACEENGKYIILGGNMRLRALQELGYKEVELSIVGAKSEKEKIEYSLSDNDRVGYYEEEKLAELIYPHIDELELEDFKIDIGEAISLKDVVEDFGPDIDEKADEVPEIDDTPAITQPGDLYQLGRHRLLCGDATKEEDVKRLLGGVRVDLVLTDPPYNVDYSSKNKFLNAYDKGNCIQIPTKNDAIGDYYGFNLSWLENVKSHLAEYNTAYIFCAGLTLKDFLNAFNDSNYYLSGVLVWVKNNIVLGRSDYLFKHEFIIYGWFGKHKFYGDKDCSVWEADKPLKSELHPTMKPVELCERAIKNSSLEGGIVLDPFGGSGSTLIASEKTNRICYMMEFEPKYCDVIIKRFSEFAGIPEEEIRKTRQAAK